MMTKTSIAGLHARIYSGLVALPAVLATVGLPANDSKAVEREPWVECLYNRVEIACKRTFLCPPEILPCNKFRLEWKDGFKDTYTRVQDGAVRNVGFYRDSRGGQWMLRGYAGSFALRNNSNGNTIIYRMTLKQCQQSGLNDLCRK